jgi:hypothetical protein
MVSAKRAPFNQLVQVDAGLHADALAQEHHFLGAHIARRPLLAGEWAAAEAGDRGVEQVDALVQRGQRVGHGQTARVVQVQAHAQRRPTLAHRTHVRRTSCCTSRPRPSPPATGLWVCRNHVTAALAAEARRVAEARLPPGTD